MKEPSYRLFVYGTLVFPEVIEALTGRVPESIPAILHGYVRYTVAGQVYPGIVKHRDSSVEGLLYTGITPEELERLNEYEDTFYELMTLDVIAGTKNLKAFVYVVPLSSIGVLDDTPWDPELFRKNQLEKFLEKF